MNMSLSEQIRRNAVALISLLVAVSSLSYNTWRNERSEVNRNQRTAAFELLLKLNELQQLVFHSHYGNTVAMENDGNPRTGWALVLTIQDLSKVCPGPLQRRADQLNTVWAENWEGLGETQSNADAILDAISDARGTSIEVINALD
ncbi:MAG: hypothetical protein H6926_05775 [Chromatiales bacterium]|nr:hypothetical protein [Zoogloeaceae bacterium]MCP5352678.1 hypothetical protein [Chromatiales bacterium]